MQEPSVGRIVHYVAYGTPGGEFPAGVCRAAVVTDVTPPPSEITPGAPPVPWKASLCVVNPTGLFFNRDLPQDEDRKLPGTWHFPERV